jgi:hypothetical protein
MNGVAHMLKLTNIWKSISTKKEGPTYGNDLRSTCNFKKKHVLGYDDSTQKNRIMQEHFQREFMCKAS